MIHRTTRLTYSGIGREEGREEGRAEGREEGRWNARQTLVSLLTANTPEEVFRLQ